METVSVVGITVQPQYLMDSLKCYLCDRCFLEGEEPWLIFEKRFQEDGQIECPLAVILSSALNREVDEKTAHSKLLCDTCNVTVLDFESIEQRFYEMRFRILTDYNKTARRNGLPSIAIEINGILQDDELLIPEEGGTQQQDDEVPEIQATEDTKDLHIVKKVMLLPDLKVSREFSDSVVDVLPQLQVNALTGSVDDDELVLDEERNMVIDETSASAIDQNYDFELLTSDDIKNENLQQTFENTDNIINVEGVELYADDIIYDEIIEHTTQLSNEDNASGDCQDFETLSNSSNTADMIYNSVLHETSVGEEVVPLQTKRQQARAPRQLKDTQAPMYEQKGDVYSCLLCADKQEFSPKLFSEHMRTDHNYRFYTCDLCGSGFSRRQDLNDHMDTEHSSAGQGNFECETCQRVFSNYRLFRIHKRMHYTNAKHFECTECNKKYTSKNLLDGHMNMHTGQRPYKCSHCPKDFASKYTLQAHMKIHSERQRPFQCDVCDKAFLNQQNLTQHRKLHSGVKAFVCEVCSKAFGTQHNLYVHQIVHSGNKPFICRTCGKAFARRAEINDHERIHTGERPFKCDMCNMAFAQRSNLTSHKKSTHFNEKQHKCDHCGRSFKRRRLLDYHFKSWHTGERPHKCEICNASFVYPEHHKKHMLIHLGVKPYACEVCGKKFNSRDNRNAHRFIHSNKKPYECLECGAGFMRKPLLLAHMQQTKHSNDTIIVNQPQIDLLNNARVESSALVAKEDLRLQQENDDVLEDDENDGSVVESYEHMMQRAESILTAVNEGNDEESNDALTSVSGQLIKDEIGDVKYLQFEELDGDGHQTLTWVDIGDKNS